MTILRFVKVLIFRFATPVFRPIRAILFVTLGCFGLDNCIKFEIVASLGPEEEQPPSGWRFAQLEVADNDFDDHKDHHNHH